MYADLLKVSPSKMHSSDFVVIKTSYSSPLLPDLGNYLKL